MHLVAAVRKAAMDDKLTLTGFADRSYPNLDITREMPRMLTATS